MADNPYLFQTGTDILAAAHRRSGAAQLDRELHTPHHRGCADEVIYNRSGRILTITDLTSHLDSIILFYRKDRI